MAGKIREGQSNRMDCYHILIQKSTGNVAGFLFIIFMYTGLQEQGTRSKDRGARGREAESYPLSPITYDLSPKGTQMEDLKNEKLLDEMDAFISENADVTSGADDDGLPFEPFDAFSTDPVEFEEMSERMLTKVENLFDLTRVYNRHSSGYLKAFALLERGIKQLGSVCITKAALRAHNAVLPELGQLTTQKLYRMASFNYRKLDTALTENLQKRNDLYPELTDAFFRCFSLLQRLRATERKIYNYFSNKYFRQENYAPAIEGFAFSPKSWTKSYISGKEEAPAFRSAPAYPVLESASRTVRSSSSEKLRIKNEEFRMISYLCLLKTSSSTHYQ